MQDNATLTCDSAVYYSDRNYFEAYRNVHINQLTTDIYSDQLEYDGNKKYAHLTSNVKMVDPQSILTTNVLDYDMVSKIGTYTNGGKIVNQDVTLTSKRGYYFSNSNDSYFRFDVVVVTPQSTIKSDTMRYNTQTKWTYFYGPTNIKGKDDNLYTEDGAYNTLTEDAYFGKKNLYTQGTRSLKGDSLYYYGKAGYGKAVKNIVFSDTKDKMKMFGDLGYYYKADQRTLVTRNAYLGIGTEDSIVVNNKKRPDSIWVGADTLETQMVFRKMLTLIPKISIKKDNEISEDEEEGDVKIKDASPANSTEKKTTAAEGKNKTTEKPDGNKETKPVKDLKLPPDDKLLKDKAGTRPNLVQNALTSKADSTKLLAGKAAADSLTTKITKPKVPDSALKSTIKKIEKDIPLQAAAGVKPDTGHTHPADTVQARIIKAYHGVKIYKSNIQAKTDSLFYTSADSTLRCFVNPIIWSEGSQQIGDTIYVQFKQNKLNNLQAFKNAFLVNTPADSLRFNQIKGRYMTGFFENGKIRTMYVDGNAESIYYTQDDSTKVYKDMNQTLSSRIKFTFKNNDIEDILYIKGVEGALNPENTIAKDHVLKGFSWKPAERPKSKKEAIGSPGNPKAKKPPVKLKPAEPVNKPDLKATPPKIQPLVPDVKKDLRPDTSNFGIKPVLPKKDSVNVIRKP